MLNKKILILSLSTVMAMSPLTVIAACATSDEGSKEENKEPTILRANQFQAQSLGLNQPILSSLSTINSQWIITNKMKIFKGTTDLLTKAEQVLDLNPKIVNQDQISVKFKLASGAYVTQNNQDNSQFSFTITDFVNDEPQPEPTKPIDLKSIADEATFDVTNKQQLASQVTPEQLVWNQKDQYPDVGFNVNNLIPDDQNGKLGYNVTFYQKTISNNTQTINIIGQDSKAINSFKQISTTPNDQDLINKEVKRLKSEEIINVNQLSTIDIINYRNQPQNFIDNLKNLKEKDFKYQILTFDVDNKDILKITLKVSNQTASANVELSKSIKVLNINIDNPVWLRNAELKRLNHLAKNSFLIQNSFTAKEIEENIKTNPNILLTKIFKFVSTYGFHYRVSDLNFQAKNKNDQTTKYIMTFNIEAMLWKTTEANKPIIKSNQFSYEIDVVYQGDIPVPKPTPEGWSITANDQATQSTNPDGSFDGSYNLTIDLKEDQSLDFAQLDFDNKYEEIEKLTAAIFKAKPEWFIKQSGKLPDNWNWNNYTIFYNQSPLTNDQGQINGIDYVAQFDYVNSDLLSDPDADNSLILNVKLINGYNSGQNQPSKPDAELLWNQYLDEFKKLISTQAFDENKLHLGFNEIYGFGQINVDSPVKNDFFANFLNFSPADFGKDRNFLIKATTQDETINYLTNTVKFKWHLEGLNNQGLGINLSGKSWTSIEQTITYKPSGNWDEQINIEESGQLAINSGAKSINHILDRFALGNQFVTEQTLKERFQRFGANWTWKAREFANYVRFTFYQAFNDGADAINMAIKNLPTTTDLSANPKDYTIVLKAKLNSKAQGNYLPYLQMFGLNVPIQAKQWNQGDVIEIRLQVVDVPQRPDVVTNGNEIFPGMGPGNVLGTGKGAVEAYINTPPRNDLYSIALGTTNLSINHNGSSYLSPQRANHRFLALTMLSRYDFKDPILPEPPVQSGWIK